MSVSDLFLPSYCFLGLKYIQENWNDNFFGMFFSKLLNPSSNSTHGVIYDYTKSS